MTLYIVFSNTEGFISYLFLLSHEMLQYRQILLCVKVCGHLFSGHTFTVSVDHGFGLMNAKAMVTAAPLWNTVNEQIICAGNLELPNL